jgi:hypothetical protein
MVTELEMAADVELAEWIDRCRHNKRGTSPGMSEVTYDLLKALPDNMLKILWELLHDCYHNKISPDEWENNWLNIIPKRLQETGIPLINDLRPLGLLDCCRKTWMSIIERKLDSIHQKFDILNQGQRGSRRSSGPQDGLLYFAAALEEAKRTESNIVASTYDLEKAYDSAHKNALKLSEARAGIPTRHSDYTIEMDMKGKTVIRTSVSEEHFNKHGYKGYSTEDKDGIKKRLPQNLERYKGM